MALREIVIDGDPILRKISRPVEKFDSKLADLLDDMAETMYLDNRGIGIAAVQVGILRRIFVVDVGDENGKLEFINPEILEREGSTFYLEGCLSCPGKNGYVERPERIRVRAQNRNGEWFELEADGLLAICICHEYDHLDGILFIDKVVELTEEQLAELEAEEEEE
ncbi:MAG: peptide deformylase [Clostridiales bacterium]|nr:peptide deformylase [Clostridiales bacterium]MBQ6271271.1 peptide deformylase [Clostridiales bacterium]MBR4010376.1 peptide deformylase [Clostridiales bacterium]